MIANYYYNKFYIINNIVILYILEPNHFQNTVLSVLTSYRFFVAVTNFLSGMIFVNNKRK